MGGHDPCNWGHRLMVIPEDISNWGHRLMVIPEDISNWGHRLMVIPEDVSNSTRIIYFLQMGRSHSENDDGSSFRWVGLHCSRKR